MIKTSPAKYLALAAASLALFAVSAQANHIDFLDSGAFNLTNIAGNPATTATIAAPPVGPDGATLGDSRFISLSALTGSVNASLNPVNPGVNDDFMVFSAMAGSSGTFNLQIGAAAALNANFLDIPGMVGTAQWDRVRITFDATVMSSMSPMITVTLTSSTAGGTTATVTQVYAGGMGGNVDFLHSAFTANNPAFTDAAFRDIDMATFTLTGIDGGVYNIAAFTRNGFVAVPEPSTYALLAVGLVGAIVMARRRRANATA